MITRPISVSVVTPVFNEGRTIASVIEVVLAWGKAREIIVVNDEATSDDTPLILERFGSAVTVVTNAKNRGKGEALAMGIEKAHGELILFLDGDITGMMRQDLNELIKPLFTGEADMTIGVARYWSIGGFAPFNGISGIRALFRKNIMYHLDQIRQAGYGVEVVLNHLHRPERIRHVPLPYVYVLGKREKNTKVSVVVEYVREAKELLVQTVRNHLVS